VGRTGAATDAAKSIRHQNALGDPDVKKACLFLLLMTSSAVAQQTVATVPVIPSEEDKKAALLWAYEANNKSMVAWGMYDATEPRSVKIERIIPIDQPDRKNKIDKMADVTPAETRPNVCKRHGLRKVTIGDRWRCRKY
jgi:hypothetical protein